MKSLATVMALLMAGALGGCAAVQDTVNRVTGNDQGLSELDANGDGVISRQEADRNRALARNFEQVDTNRDQNINRAELRAAHTRVGEVDFRQIDYNGDGVVSKREAEAVPPSLDQAFDRIDADGDGNVSQSEYQAARLNLLGDTEFAAFDTDGDGVIDSREAQDEIALREDFNKIDVDDDGLISDEEFARARAR